MDPGAVAEKPISDKARSLHWRDMAEAYTYYTAFVNERSERPGDDLISAMLQLRGEAG
jgi:cytochrome P450